MSLEALLHRVDSTETIKGTWGEVAGGWLNFSTARTIQDDTVEIPIVARSFVWSLVTFRPRLGTAGPGRNPAEENPSHKIEIW